MSSVLFGVSAAASATGAGTTGLFGSLGSFSAVQTLGTTGLLASLGGTAAAISNQNAAADVQADYAEDVAAYNAAAKRDRYRLMLSSQKAGYGASGVQLDDGGTPSDVLAATQVDMEMDALATYYGGKSKGIAYQNQAQANSTAYLFNGLANAGSGAYSLLR